MKDSLPGGPFFVYMYAFDYHLIKTLVIKRCEDYSVHWDLFKAEKYVRMWYSFAPHAVPCKKLFNGAIQLTMGRRSQHSCQRQVDCLL